MRTPKRKSAALVAKPEIQTDAQGHEWSADLYRTNADGSPKLTKSGSYWLKPGKSHA